MPYWFRPIANLIYCTLEDVDESKDHCMQTEKHIIGIHRVNAVWVFLQELFLLRL